MPKHIEVVGAVFLRNGTVFAARRGPDKALPGLWEFPGGKIEPGETAEEALARELKEELLIDAHVGTHLITTQQNYDFGVVNLSTYYCELRSGEPQLTEHTEARWVPYSQLLDLEWAPADIPAVHVILRDSVINE